MPIKVSAGKRALPGLRLTGIATQCGYDEKSIFSSGFTSATFFALTSFFTFGLLTAFFVAISSLPSQPAPYSMRTSSLRNLPPASKSLHRLSKDLAALRLSIAASRELSS